MAESFSSVARSGKQGGEPRRMKGLKQAKRQAIRRDAFCEYNGTGPGHATVLDIGWTIQGGQDRRKRPS